MSRKLAPQLIAPGASRIRIASKYNLWQGIPQGPGQIRKKGL